MTCPSTSGIPKDARLRYEEIRDDYLKSGRKVQESVLRDLDVYFKNIRIGAIGEKLNALREWRGGLARVVEYKQETLTKEIAFRKMKAMKDRKKPLSAIEIAGIENEAKEWVDYAFEKTKGINLGDVPYFPIRGKAADSVRQGKFSEADFANILGEIAEVSSPVGEAPALDRNAYSSGDMIDDDNVLRLPGFLTKNGQP